MFHVAVCQKDHKVGKRSRHKKAGGTCCWGEMFGASIGDKIVRKVDGTKYAQVLQCDGSFVRDRAMWDAAIDGHRHDIYVRNNADNCR
jgi:hypothetical protein